ncbi:protease modulator HflK [Pantoea sp. B65]|uniref:protease modulator HflK n=1 Tax=Pantoea sp. B65 TaxID=2813359 RepID=UPI0039B4203A
MRKQSLALSPWGQSYRIAFFGLYAATLLAALAWVVSSFHQVTPDTQAIVFRFGKPVKVESSGMLFAWPNPVDRVEIIPGPARILQQDVLPLQRREQQKLLTGDQYSRDAGAGAGYLLTGDAGIVQLNIQVFYRISSPLNYVLQKQHIAPLIDRLAQRAATLVSAGRDLDTILVARPEMLQNDSHAAQERSRLRSDLKQIMSQDLQKLKGDGNDPGITIKRIDIASSLPDSAVDAFNAVLTASQKAEQTIAQAQKDATLRLQKAQQQSDGVIQQAQADGQEMRAQAEVATQTMTKLAQARATGTDAGMLSRLWQENITKILSHAGQVITVSPTDKGKLILPGPAPQTDESSALQMFGGIP